MRTGSAIVQELVTASRRAAKAPAWYVDRIRNPVNSQDIPITHLNEGTRQATIRDEWDALVAPIVRNGVITGFSMVLSTEVATEGIWVLNVDKLNRDAFGMMADDAGAQVAEFDFGPECRARRC